VVLSVNTNQPSDAAAGRALSVKPWGDHYLNHQPGWYASSKARAIADNLIDWQSPEGAWPKNVDLTTPATPEAIAQAEADGKANTIDNNATTMPMRFIALVAQATGDPEYKASFDRGLDYLFAAQYDNGGWPQFFPLREGYYSHITFNDDAMMNVMFLLRDVAAGRSPYSFVDQDRRSRATNAVQRGVDCILKTQVRVDGKLTAWSAQHDEVTLAPAWARNFEPPTLSGQESVPVIRFLMEIEDPTPEEIAAIEGAVAWLDEVAIYGLNYLRISPEDGGEDGFVVEDSTAGPLWARFYEIGTNRPVFTGRDKVIHYSLDEVERERRAGYSYYGSWGESLLARDYPDWRARQQADTGSILRIMPLGDSITYDNRRKDMRPTGVRLAYRYTLYELLKSGGYSFDFVGSEDAGERYLREEMDDNAGFPGITDDQLAVLISTGFAGHTSTQITPGPYLDSYPADIILLHIGTNKVDPSPDDVRDLLDNIRKSDPDVFIIMARIINRYPYDETTTSFNDNVEAMVKARGDERIIMVDMEDGAGIDYYTDMDDDLHPNHLGYDKMAAVWYEALVELLATPEFSGTQVQ
jgi:PelA/Pel-15E family pectate lyase